MMIMIYDNEWNDIIYDEWWNDEYDEMIINDDNDEYEWMMNEMMIMIYEMMNDE